MPYPYASDRDELLSRLRKIEGQVRGVQRMVSSDKDCVDVLAQISAVVSGMEKVALRLLAGHVGSSVGEAVAAMDPDAKIDDAMRAVERFLQA
jgi:CsoR family transcriptional regulator, copper-sensing transcriptional repressor